MVDPVNVAALKPVVQVLQSLGVAYHVGGSVASSIYGVARSTLDVDVVADLDLEHVEPLVEELQAAFYVDGAMIEDAIRRRSWFNVVHLPTMTQVDVYIPGEGPFDRLGLERAREDTLVDEAGADLYFVASPEDVVLRKLEWYRAGGEVSERQWGDVVGVLKVMGDGLDWLYLREWAGRLGVSDLLKRAMGEAGI
jgi:hypothetical protein